MLYTYTRHKDRALCGVMELLSSAITMQGTVVILVSLSVLKLSYV